MATDTCLIIEQQRHAAEEITPLLKELATRFQLDAYNCRQLLLGAGQALLTKGTADKLAELKTTLAGYQVDSHIVSPSHITFSPFVLSSLEVQDHTLKFIGREKELSIPRHSRVLILLAELSGSLAERSLSQILSDHRYRGTATNRGLSDDKCQRSILQGRPVLDIYLLDDAGRPNAAVRAFPGKFNPQGLGERATLSANQNLLQLMEVTREYATTRVDMRFGLSPLPGARLEPGATNDLERLKKNLRNLTRYAWLQADIDRQRQTNQQTCDLAQQAGLTTLLTATHPESIASLPVQQIMTELNPQPTQKKPHNDERSTAPLLPVPPDAQQHKLWTKTGTIALSLGLGLLFLLAKSTQIRTEIGPLVARSFSSGALSALLSAGFLIAGFRLLQLKRMIENTPTSKIRSIAMGRVEVQGIARRQYALFSPLTNIPCIYYRLVRYKKNHKNDWVISSISSSGYVPFWLEDETGRVSIDPRAAKINAEHKQESSNRGNTTFGGSHSADEKWVEEMIYDGARVYVLGEAQVKRSMRLPRQQRRAEALRRIKQDKQKLASYDSNGDGRIDAGEWQAAGDDVDEQLLREDLKASSKHRRQEDQVVIGKPRQRGMPFVIAETASEEKLTHHYALFINLLFALGTTLSGVSLWLALK